MVKNKLEKQFSKSLKTYLDFWGMKLHNNMLAHQTTPGDYIISHLEEIGLNDMGNEIEALRLLLVECKQVTCSTDENRRFAFKRLKQLPDLIGFEAKFPYHHFSWLCLGFIEQRWENSEVYLIPIKTFSDHIKSSMKVSINRNECKEFFNRHQIDILKGSILNLEVLKSKNQ
jgi:hypothetical protein